MMTQVVALADHTDPRVERREGARQRLMLRSAKLRCFSGEYVCTIHDVSETGLKLRMFHEPPPEAFMFVELSNGEGYAMERRWTDGDFAGFRFSSTIDVEEFIHEPSPKEQRRISLSLEHPVTIVAAGETSSAMLGGLSSQEACISSDSYLAVGMPIRIEILGLPCFAYVRWRKGCLHGVAFHEAFALEDFARLALDLQPYVSKRPIEAVSECVPAALCA